MCSFHDRYLLERVWQAIPDNVNELIEQEVRARQAKASLKWLQELAQ